MIEMAITFSVDSIGRKEIPDKMSYLRCHMYAKLTGTIFFFSSTSSSIFASSYL
jgi:hypothetical protein